jgi:hypothetical protein
MTQSMTGDHDPDRVILLIPYAWFWDNGKDFGGTCRVDIPRQYILSSPATRAYLDVKGRRHTKSPPLAMRLCDVTRFGCGWCNRGAACAAAHVQCPEALLHAEFYYGPYRRFRWDATPSPLPPPPRPTSAAVAFNHKTIECLVQHLVWFVLRTKRPLPDSEEDIDDDDNDYTMNLSGIPVHRSRQHHLTHNPYPTRDI